MKILLTGGTGILGSALLRKLAFDQHDITVLTRSPLPSTKNVTYILWDLQSACPLVLQEKFDVLIHLAWEILPQYSNPFHLTDILPNHIKFFNEIIENKVVKKIIITGTCFEYGRQYGELLEDQATYPVTPYAVAKDLLRRFVMKKAKEFDINTFWLRIFYLHDAGLSQRSLLGKIRMVADDNGAIDLSDCTQQLDYIDHERVLNFIMLLLTTKSESQVINVSSGEPKKLKDIVENFVCSEKLTVQLNYGKIQKADYESDYCWGNNSRLKEIEKSG